MKRILSLAVLLSFGLAAAPVSAAEVFNFKFGTLAPDNTPWSALLQEFKKKVEERSKNQIKMKIFLNGILGDERAMLQKMKFGQLTGGGFSTSGISTVVPELQIFEVPFLFRNNEEVDYVLDHVVREEMSKALAAKGLYLMMWAENGWLDFGNSKRELHSPADMKETKWFTQESDVMIAFFHSLNATAVPLAVPEVLSALQTGIVGGYHTTPVFASGAQWYSQTKYWTVSHHQYQPAAVVVDMKFWNKLPPDVKAIVTEIGNELQPKARADVRGLDKDLLKGFTENGIKINTLTESERAVFEKATAGVGDEMVKKGVFSKPLYEKTRKALAEFRAKKGKK